MRLKKKKREEECYEMAPHACFRLCHDHFDDVQHLGSKGGDEDCLHVTIELLHGTYKQCGAVKIAACWNCLSVLTLPLS